MPEADGREESTPDRKLQNQKINKNVHEATFNGAAKNKRKRFSSPKIFFFDEQKGVLTERTKKVLGGRSQFFRRQHHEATSNDHRLLLPPSTPCDRLCCRRGPEVWLSDITTLRRIGALRLSYCSVVDYCSHRAHLGTGSAPAVAPEVWLRDLTSSRWIGDLCLL